MINKKRLISMLLLLAFSISSLTCISYAEAKNENAILADELLEKSLTFDDSIVIVDDSNLNDFVNEVNDNRDNAISSLESDGIIVYTGTNTEENGISSSLGFSFDSYDDNSDTTSKSKASLAPNLQEEHIITITPTTVATIYYLNEFGKPVIHQVALTNDMIGFKESIIEKNIAEIQEKLNSTSKLKPQASLSFKSDKELEYLGENTYSMTSSYGTWESFYSIYGITDVNNKDYFTVMGTIIANPGIALYNNGDTSYKKYDGEKLEFTYESDCHKRIDYGPKRTKKNKTTSFDLSVNYSSENILTGGFSLGRSWTCSDTTIDVTSSTEKTNWVVKMSDDAQKQTLTFYPSINVYRDAVVGLQDISTLTSFTVDSFFGFETEIAHSNTLVIKDDEAY